MYLKRQFSKCGFETANDLGDTIEKNEFFQQQRGRDKCFNQKNKENPCVLISNSVSGENLLFFN